METPLQFELLSTLKQLGVASSAQLQAATGRSQPTLSRLLRGLSSEVVALGSGRQTRYGLPQPLLGAPAVQPLLWVLPDGQVQRWGRLSFLQGDRVHVQAEGMDSLTQAGLPWFLAPLRAQGFLGRVLARQWAVRGLDANPERWSLEQVLATALTLHDAPGAIVLGEPPAAGRAPVPQPGVSPDLDALADAVAATLPAGSSAGGEQAKFLTHEEAGHPLIVKFTPPLATPFGDRWRDLLQAEALALQVLADWGVPVAASEVVETGRRAFLVSRRFDRLPGGGRLHVVPLDAVHDAFVAGGRQHWGATCHALERQRRLPAGAGMQAEALLHFGRLIGNTDMHFGNLSLVVQPQGVPGGRFAGLAPVYDMLPMRWRPDAAIGLVDIEPFSPDELAMGSPARAPALQFWQRLADLPAASRPLRRTAQAMAQRLR
ncbi:HipA domain-containing protein [Aquincola tertiaricarbonis]|uniref:HipA domain-containing protein n=1 Tax=Aquincola tertiaricarbonis TaxID=391953 RepID=UPI0006151ED1|nr:HipA domain-containing protein [Aquincola tertiaricarbonis]